MIWPIRFRWSQPKRQTKFLLFKRIVLIIAAYNSFVRIVMAIWMTNLIHPNNFSFSSLILKYKATIKSSFFDLIGLYCYGMMSQKVSLYITNIDIVGILYTMTFNQLFKASTCPLVNSIFYLC